MKTTQKQEILDYMQEHGSITQLDALREIGCMRLASRIHDLKDEGYNIESRMEGYKNAKGRVVSYARYTLV